MSANSFKELIKHIGHELVCVSYGKDTRSENVGIECIYCNEVLVDFDKEVC